jgi:protein farnesyltransferase subunit beta
MLESRILILFLPNTGGEGDLRACYIAMAIAHMLGLDKDELIRKSNMVNYVQQCQTYEGGLGGEPGNEAHGGYTYCGLAALALAGKMDAIDLPRLIRWAVQRQGSMEGGFNGRTNKLVDGCYSFWQGGLFPLLQKLNPQLLADSDLLGFHESQSTASQEFPVVVGMPIDLEVRQAFV